MQSRDEADLIKQAKKQLQLHKQATQKLSRCAGEDRCKCLGEALGPHCVEVAGDGGPDLGSRPAPTPANFSPPT